jgi:CheY-like chemotaxis protein
LESAPLILVVDDDALNRELMTSILLAFEYRAMVVNSGEKALRIAQEKQPALIISDINMPNMDGYELTRHLKELPSTVNIPVLLMSGIQGSQHEKRRAIEAGAAALFIRGNNVAELAVLIEQLLPND